MTREDIWKATRPRDDPADIPELPDIPETHDEFYEQLDQEFGEMPPLEEHFMNKLRGFYIDSLADAVGRVTLRGHYTPSIKSKNDFSDKFGPIESLKIYVYLRLSPNGQLSMARKSRSPVFQNSLNLDDSLSQPTIGRIHNRVEERVPSWADYFDRVRHDILIQVQGTEYEDWFADSPTVSFDGGDVPEVKKISRKLRQYIYPFIKLDRGQQVKYSKDDLLKILAAAGRWSCQPNQAADAMELKPWNHGRDVPDSSTLFYKIWPMEKQQVMEMFIVCHEALFRLAQDYMDLGSKTEVAIDITDWPTFGDPDASSGISGTKPGRNFSHAWQYATLSIVGDQAPMTLAAIPMERRKNSNIAMRKLFTYADSKFDIDRVYLDSGFYSTKVRKVCDDYDVNFVMKAKEKAHAIDDLTDAAISLDDPGRSREWSVGDWPEEDYLWVLPSEKRASRRDGEPDHPRQDWTTFYSDINPDDYGAGELAADYRKRWAVETKYRVIKHRFLPQCASREEHVRAFVVNYAALLYNMWQVSNLIASDRDAEEESRHYQANYFLGSIVDDSKRIETASVGDLSEHSEVIHESPWF